MEGQRIGARRAALGAANGQKQQSIAEVGDALAALGSKLVNDVGIPVAHCNTIQHCMDTSHSRNGPQSDENVASAPACVRAGRRRDASIDARILSAARRQLACVGYEGMSLASVAEEASTTRQALYRRWQHKAALAADAIGIQEPLSELCVSSDPRGDLERELEHFAALMAAPEQLSLAGTMLQDATDDGSRAEY